MLLVDMNHGRKIIVIIITNLQFHELSGTFGGDGFLYQNMILFVGGLTLCGFAMSVIVLVVEFFLGSLLVG